MVKLPTPEYSRFDKRVLDRLKASGRLRDKEYQTYLEQLPDDTSEYDSVAIWERDVLLPSQRPRKPVVEVDSDMPAPGNFEEQESRDQFKPTEIRSDFEAQTPNADSTEEFP